MGRFRAGSGSSASADRGGVSGLRGEIGVGIRCLDASAPVPVEVQRLAGTGGKAPTRSSADRDQPPMWAPFSVSSNAAQGGTGAGRLHRPVLSLSKDPGEQHRPEVSWHGDMGSGSSRASVAAWRGASGTVPPGAQAWRAVTAAPSGSAGSAAHAGDGTHHGPARGARRRARHPGPAHQRAPGQPDAPPRRGRCPRPRRIAAQAARLWDGRYAPSHSEPPCRSR